MPLQRALITHAEKIMRLPCAQLLPEFVEPLVEIVKFGKLDVNSRLCRRRIRNFS